MRISTAPDLQLDPSGRRVRGQHFGDFIEDEAAESPINAATQEMLKEKIDSVLKGNASTYR